MMAAVEKPARRTNDPAFSNSEFKPSTRGREWPDHCRSPQRLMHSKPSHFLSKRSSELKRDTFIWVNTFPSALLLGINQRLTPVTPVTSATLQRWTKELNPLFWGPFILAPVDVAPYGVMSYTIEAPGPEIPSLSTDLPPPGDYGWFFPSGGSGVRWVRHLQDMQSFRAMQREHIESGIIYAELGDPHRLFDVPPTIQIQVRQRDGNRCPFTGELPGQMTGICWMNPPFFSQLVLPANNISRAEMGVSSNCTVMHKELIPYFVDNAFGVDIYDNYCIIIFRHMGAVRHLLPTHISPPPGFETLRFVEAHFHSSLRANILHGDVKDEYGPRAIEKLMDELGVGGDDGDEMAPLSDSRWKTVIGKAILEEIVRGRLAADSYD